MAACLDERWRIPSILARDFPWSGLELANFGFRGEGLGPILVDPLREVMGSVRPQSRWKTKDSVCRDSRVVLILPVLRTLLRIVRNLRRLVGGRGNWGVMQGTNLVSS